MFPTPTLGLGEQVAYLRLHWPSFRSERRGATLTARGTLQPTEISELYEVEVTQHGGGAPEVRVIEPKLCGREDGEPIPHMYSQERLCLYLPGADEWKRSDPIALTILPWSSLWLTFYEVWHATGDWLGGGVHPEVPVTVRRRNRRSNWRNE